MMINLKAALAALGILLAGSGHAHHHAVHQPQLSRQEATVWNAFRSKGFSKVQAAGALANAEHESSLNVENQAWDTNGYRGYGLFSWNLQFYPGASKLVTGHPQADLARQVGYLVHDTEHLGPGLVGQTAAEVGGNWAEHVEGCQGCWPQGHQWYTRSALAAQLFTEAVHTKGAR